MDKKMGKLLSTAVLALGLGVASSASVAGIANNKTIDSVGCYDLEGTNVACFIILAGSAVGPGACANTQLRWDGTTTSGKNLTAVSMTAYALGNPVKLSYDDEDCYADGTTFPKMKWLYME